MSPGMKMYGKHRFPGKLFIVEGIDGSGKSTHLRPARGIGGKAGSDHGSARFDHMPSSK